MYKNVWAGECGCFKAKIIRNPSLEKIEIGGDAYFHFENLFHGSSHISGNAMKYINYIIDGYDIIDDIDNNGNDDKRLRSVSLKIAIQLNLLN